MDVVALGDSYIALFKHTLPLCFGLSLWWTGLDRPDHSWAILTLRCVDDVTHYSVTLCPNSSGTVSSKLASVDLTTLGDAKARRAGPYLGSSCII